MSNAIATIREDIYSTRDSFAAVLSEPGLNFEREAGFAVQAIQANDFTTKVAANNRQSVVNAVTNIAAIGISLNPAKKQAYLVPRDGKVCLDISYMGLMDLAMAGGSIRWAQAEIVHKGDRFELNGLDRPPTHNFDPFGSDRGDVVGAYVVVKTIDGDYLTTCMSRADIDAIMNRSQSVRSGKSSPWKTDYGEMAKKTVVKRAYKYWPKTDRLDQAIHHLNTDGGEGMSPAAPKTDEALAQKWLDIAHQAADSDELASIWRDGVAEIQKARDMDAYNRFKAEVERLGEGLKSSRPDAESGNTYEGETA